MRTPEEEVAYEVLLRDGVWGMTGCLEQAKACVALRGHDTLDELTQLHVRILALMCAGLNCNNLSMEAHFGQSLGDMAERLDALLEAGYATWNGIEHEATADGRNIARQIGVEMLGLDRFRMNGELQKSERLLEKLQL